MTKGSDFCEINDDIRIDGSSATVFIASADQTAISAENSSWIIRPYSRKYDRYVMKRVKEWSVISATSFEELPECNQNHSVPAVLFSNGGYAGNIFHDFSDIIIPLYVNSRQFNGEVKFVITNKQSWWIKKYRNILKLLSKYDVIDIDNEEDVHCFRTGIIGLQRHDKELNIDPSISTYSLKDFRQFIRSSFSLPKVAAIRMKDGEKRKPRLLIIARKRTRAFTNPEEIARMARKLGFEVVVTEASGDISRFAETVNSCDVFLAVHGAAMTNMIFLPENAVFIQVVPFGGFEWLARTDYEEPAKAMKLKYLEYKIKLEESTLIQQYPLDHEVIRNPTKVGKQGWNVFRSVYMVKQNVKVDLNRFRSTLLKALELLGQ